jgi:hypothetical protein
VDDCSNPSRELAVYGLTPQPGSHGERFNPRRNVLGRIRMNRAAPAIVAGIQRPEQLDHFTASYFSHHESVRPHAQRLPD